MNNSHPPEGMRLTCAYCGRDAEDCSEYDVHLDYYSSRVEAVWNEEGTLNRKTGKFACDQCYIDIGLPTAVGGWVAGDTL